MATHPPIEILPPPAGSLEDRERRLIEAVVSLTRSLRDEHDRLLARLRKVELELRRLTSTPAEAFSDPETDARAARPPRPSRTSA